MNISQLYPTPFANGNDIGAATHPAHLQSHHEQVGPVRKTRHGSEPTKASSHATSPARSPPSTATTPTVARQRVTIHTVPSSAPTAPRSIRARAEDAPANCLPTACHRHCRSAYTGEDLPTRRPRPPLEAASRNPPGRRRHIAAAVADAS